MATRAWSTVWKGTYDNATAYVIGDFVLYSGATYTCISDSTGNLPTDTDYWVKVADKGDTGDTGATGATGSKGDTGDAATISVGTTTTGDAGSDASVSNSGTTSAAVLDFTIPKGDKGDKGDTGATGTAGTNGSDGDNAYVYIAYASDSSGTGFTTIFDSSLDYIAIKSTAIEIASPSVSDFTGLWKNYKGEKGDTGATGATGPAGADGTGSGDMMASTYDPNNVAADAFDMDNMVQGTTNKFVTAAEKTVLGNTSGTNTGDQTSVTGNAGTATKLQTARNIAGVSFDGSTDISITAADVSAIPSSDAPIGTIVGMTDSQTITNKRNEPRTSSNTSTSTLTPSKATADIYYLTAQSADLTIAAPTGTPVQGEVLAIYITDDGTSRALTFNSVFVAFGAPLPTATTAGKTLQIIAQYDGTNWSTQTAVQQ